MIDSQDLEISIPRIRVNRNVGYFGRHFICYPFRLESGVLNAGICWAEVDCSCHLRKSCSRVYVENTVSICGSLLKIIAMIITHRFRCCSLRVLSGFEPISGCLSETEVSLRYF